MGSAPKRKNIDIQRYTRVGLGCQFTSNLLSFHHMHSSSFTILHFFEQEKTNMTWKKKNVDKRIYRKQFLVFCEYFTWQRACVEHILLCNGLPVKLTRAPFRESYFCFLSVFPWPRGEREFPSNWAEILAPSFKLEIRPPHFLSFIILINRYRANV